MKSKSSCWTKDSAAGASSGAAPAMPSYASNAARTGRANARRSLPIPASPEGVADAGDVVAAVEPRAATVDAAAVVAVGAGGAARAARAVAPVAVSADPAPSVRPS